MDIHKAIETANLIGGEVTRFNLNEFDVKRDKVRITVGRFGVIITAKVFVGHSWVDVNAEAGTLSECLEKVQSEIDTALRNVAGASSLVEEITRKAKEGA